MRAILLFAFVIFFGNIFSQRRVAPVTDNVNEINLHGLNKNVLGPAIITNSSNYSPTQLIQDVLINGCVSASNITFTGATNARGFFDANGSNFPFSSGIILASGNISTAIGPNSSGSSGDDITDINDADLNSIVFPQSIEDGVKLEFDFIPSSDTIEFRYIFASEEYNEFVCSNFNDAFGFFLSGPGINGTYTNNAINIAQVPGTNMAVSINNVNNGTVGSSGSNLNCTSAQLANSQYFYDNTGGSGQAIQYDGRTVPLIAKAIVQACQTYHIKLIVADVADGSYDSGVFIEAGSFSSGGQVAMNNFSQVGDNNSLYEGCENYYVFSRLDSTDLSDSVEVILSYSGTAVQGVDISTTNPEYYPNFPTSFWIPVGQISDTIYYTAHNDSIDEIDEFLVLTLLSGCPCNMNAVTDTIFIFDVDKIKGGIQTVADSVMFCNDAIPDSIMIIAYVNIDDPTYEWSTGDVGSTMYAPQITGRTMYYVTISDPCGNQIIDSIPVIIGDFEGIDIDVQQPLCHDSCNGAINVTAINGIPPFTYNWIPNGTSTNGSASNLCEGNYKVTVTDSIGCEYKTSSFIYLLNPDLLSISSSINNIATQYCNGSGTNISVTTQTEATSLQYLWNTGETTADITVNLSNGNNIFWVKFQDFCNNSFTDSITLRASDISAPNISTTNILCYNSCNGTVNVSPVGGSIPYTYQWYPNGTGSSASGSINNLCKGTYNVTVTDIAGCSKSASFAITEPLELTTSYSSTNATCYNSCNGTANVSASGGTSPYTFTWIPQSTGNSGFVDSLCNGTYLVTIADANDCSNTINFSISAPNELIASVVSDSTCFNTCDGTLTVTPTGGTTPYVYSWNPSNIGLSNSGAITSICKGNYGVTVTDNNNCSVSKLFDIFERNDLILTSSVLALDSVSLCVGSALVSASGGTSPFSYLWSNTTQSTTPQVDNLCAGTYTITVSDANDCKNQTSVTIFLTSIDENDYSQYFTIYPNPAQDGKINLKLNGIQPSDVKISLYDISGKQMLIDNINEQSDVISLGNIASGVYNLNVTIKEKTFNQRIVVRK